MLSLFVRKIYSISLIRIFLYQVVFFFSLVKYPEKGITYEKYKYPVWAEVFGWLVAALPMVCIPAYAIFRITKATGTFKEVYIYIIENNIPSNYQYSNALIIN